MRIIEPESWDRTQLAAELEGGARLVVFQYCVSLLVVSFKRTSSIYLLRPGDQPVRQSLQFSLCSFILGWWGFPWGPIWTVSTIFRNCRGGVDVTQDVLDILRSPPPSPRNLDGLRAGLHSPDPEVREDCASRLGDMGAAALVALPELETLLHDQHRLVRIRATWAIETIRRAPRA